MPQELHAHACCVVFRIVRIEALAVRYVHSPQAQGQALPVVQSIRKSGAESEHELIAGGACGELSVVEKDACAPVKRNRQVPAAREFGPHCQNGSCAGRGALEDLVFERARFERAGPEGYGSASARDGQASIERETFNIKTLRAEEEIEVRRVDLAVVLGGPELLQPNYDFPPGLCLRPNIRFFLSLA